VAACSGKCGRDGAGPVHSGDPERDRRFTWCDYCWSDLMNKRMPPGLVKDLPPGTMIPFQPSPVTVPELSALARTEAKTAATVALAPVTGSGTFSGYLAAFGRDHSGDTIQPGAMDASAAMVNSGGIVWCLTDAHSDLASDVVATVTAAAVDSRGLRIEGQWMPTERGQQLRQMVANGARLGLSIDYLTDSARPDGKGGRLLDQITVVGGAITPKPLNPMAYIIAGKGAGTWAPVTDIYADAQARRRDPDRERRRAEDAMLAAADWPPRNLPRDIRLSLLNGAAASKAARIPAFDDGARVQRERWQQANAYSYGLAEWMAANR
jgi:hypothetical protein